MQVLEGLQLTREQFIDVCILCGCDYCGSIRGACFRLRYLPGLVSPALCRASWLAQQHCILGKQASTTTRQLTGCMPSCKSVWQQGCLLRTHSH